MFYFTFVFIQKAVRHSNVLLHANSCLYKNKKIYYCQPGGPSLAQLVERLTVVVYT